MFNENVAVADLDGDGDKELIGPTDTHYVTALDRDAVLGHVVVQDLDGDALLGLRVTPLVHPTHRAVRDGRDHHVLAQAAAQARICLLYTSRCV